MEILDSGGLQRVADVDDAIGGNPKGDLTADVTVLDSAIEKIAFRFLSRSDNVPDRLEERGKKER